MYLIGSDTLKMKANNYQEAMNLFQRGLKYRSVGKTKLNDQSSRSHSILFLTIEKKIFKNNSSVASSSISSKLHFVDLAGTEV